MRESFMQCMRTFFLCISKDLEWYQCNLYQKEMRIEEIVKDKYDLLSKVFEKLNDGVIIRGKDINTFIIMCINAQEDGKLSVSKNLRYEFEDMLSLTTQSLSNSIARLKEGGLVEGERGIYILKPEVLWKGDLESRKKFFTEGESFEIVVKMK